MKSKPVGIIDLMGGLGNQLFQVCFADSLKNKGLNIFLSDSWFLENNKQNILTERKLNLDPKHFGFDFPGKDLQIKYNFLEFMHKKKLVGKKTYYLHEDTNFSLSNLAKYNKFYGYWHESRFIEKKQDFLIASLSQNKYFLDSSKQRLHKTMVHVRRGDYKKLNLTLPEQYYINAINELKSIKGEIEYDIFTDDKKYDENNSLFKNAQNIFYDPSENPISTLSKMISYKHLIIANSSLSFFAAFLNKYVELVFYPDPWFQNISYTPPVLNNWSPISI